MGHDPIVVCVGDALLDLLSQVPELPQRGGAVWGPPFERSAGGTGANVAAGLAELGVRVAFVGRVGDDEAGRFLRADLDQRGIDISGVRSDGESGTAVVVTLIEPDGERTFVVGGLNAAHTRLADADFEVVDTLAPTAVFFTGLLLLEEPARSASIRLAQRLRGKTRLYFDPNLRQPRPGTAQVVAEAMRTLAELCEVVLVGEDELRELSLERHPGQLFVVKRGSRGAYLQGDGGGQTDIPGLNVAVVDATGAGDTFDAAFIAAQLRGYADSEAIRVANIAAALSVTRLGARTMPAWATIQAYGGQGEAQHHER